MCERVFFSGRPFFRLSGERRRRGRRGERKRREGTKRKVHRTNPIPSVCSRSSFSRPSLFLSFRFYVRFAPFSFGRALLATLATPAPTPFPLPLPSTRLEFIFPYESSVLNSRRHAGFKYGQPCRVCRDICACLRRNYKMQKGDATTMVY